MFKFPKKINLSDPEVFWRYAVTTFGVGLILVFVGQTIFMFIVNETGQTQTVAPLVSSSVSELDAKKSSEILKELDLRPARLEATLATSTLFVDPSL